MKVTVVGKKVREVAADFYVVPVVKGAETGGAVKDLAPAVRKNVEARVKRVGFTAKAGATLSVQSDNGDFLLVGIGDGKNFEAYRRAAAKGRAAAAGAKAAKVAMCAASGKSAEASMTALIEGALLSAYKFDKYKSKKKGAKAKPKTPSLKELIICGTGLPAAAAARDEISRVENIIDGVLIARDLVNEMAAVKTPTFLAKTARELARKHKFSCEVWQGARLKKEKMNGIIAVSAGSEEPGAFIKMVYKPSRRPTAKVAVVGKGITFDSGGLSLKPAKSMEWMKQDMAGAAAVLGMMRAVAALKPRAEVRGYIASAENMPGARAQKPGDVITYRNGTTAEVLNTDAEGRLVLGDALCVAAEEKPDVIIDLATLTGACMVALGTKYAGVMGTDQDLMDALMEHGGEQGELIWQLPLAEEEYMEDIRSRTADIKNIGGGWAGTITAALFLRRFVGDNAWAHLDIAGPAFTEGPRPYSPTGGTGFGVRTLVSYIDSL